MLKKIAQQIDRENYIPAKIVPGLILNEQSLKSGESIIREKKAMPFIVTKVFYQTSRYSIFEVNGSKYIEYITIDDAKYNTQAITPKLNRIDFWLRDSRLKEGDNNFLETAADAVAQCLEGKTEAALQTVGDLETLIKNEVYKFSKMFYLLPYLFLVLGMVGLSLIIHYQCICFGKYCGTCWCARFESFFHMCTFGAIGGLLSVSRHMDSYSVEIKYKKGWLLSSILEKFLIAVLVRFSVSILGAVTLYVFLKSGILKADLYAGSSYITYSLALLAGFSENLVPSMMTRFETNILTKDATRVAPEPTQPFSTPQNTVVVTTPNPIPTNSNPATTNQQNPLARPDEDTPVG